MALPLRIALSLLSRPHRHRYGPAFSQVADLHVPRGAGPFPVAVLVHGGHWHTRFGSVVCRPLALDLVRHGWAAWNLEYRRLGPGRGGGGGWPATFDDVAAGTDALAGLADPRLDLSRVVHVGHSAGGQLALWAAGRASLLAGAPGADPVVHTFRVLGLSPVTHLSRAGGAARALVGASPEERPDRWRQADPSLAAPPPVPVLVVHPQGDTTIPVELSRRYVAACRAGGGRAELVEPPGGTHREPIDPASDSWRAGRAWLLDG